MKKILTVFLMYAILLNVLAVILFDPSGVALGTIMWNVSDTVIAIAGILGSVYWAGGLVLWMFVIILIVANSKTSTIGIDTVSEYTEDIKKEISKPVSKFKRFNQTLWVLTGIFATGSGFWFTGPAIIAFIVSIHFTQEIARKNIRKLKLMKEEGETNE